MESGKIIRWEKNADREDGTHQRRNNWRVDLLCCDHQQQHEQRQQQHQDTSAAAGATARGREGRLRNLKNNSQISPSLRPPLALLRKPMLTTISGKENTRLTKKIFRALLIAALIYHATTRSRQHEQDKKRGGGKDRVWG